MTRKRRGLVEPYMPRAEHSLGFSATPSGHWPTHLPASLPQAAAGRRRKIRTGKGNMQMVHSRPAQPRR